MVLQGVARLLYTVLLGRTFGTEALGHASALLSLSVFAALLWPTPAGTAASRFLAVGLARRSGDAAVRRALDVSMLVSSVVLAVLTVPVAIALGNGMVTAMTAAWLVVAYGCYAFARGARLGRHGAARVALWDVVSGLAALGALVGVCASGASAVVLVPLAAGYTAFAVACWPRRSPSVPGRGPAAREALVFAAWNVLTGLATNGLLQLAMIVAQLNGDGREAGVYAAAFTLATPASMLGQAVSQVVIPAFAHRAGGAPLRERAPVVLTLVFAAGATVVFGGVAASSPVFLPWFYPDQAADAAGPFRFLMVGVLVFTVGLVPAALLLAVGRSRDVAVSSSAGFVVGLAVTAVAGPGWGVEAGSLGFLAGSCVTLVAVVVRASSRTDQTKRRTTAQ